MRTPLTWIGCAVLATALTVAACGGDSSPTTPSPSPTPSPTPTPTPTPSPGAGTTITITASGVSPKSLTVSVGSRVTFVNNSSQPHDMNSNPHPEHTDCPEINFVDLLTVGQTKLTGNLNTPRTCGYHDHLNDTNNSLRGSIVIQ